MAINVNALARLRALAKSQKFKDIAAAGGGGLVGGAIGVASNSAMNPTKSDKNNQGNQSGTNGESIIPASPAPAATQTPSITGVKEAVETPSLKGAGEMDPTKYVSDLLEKLDPIQARALERNIQAQLILGEAAERSAMAKTREQSARQIELENIKAWRGITEAQINREASIALNMSEIAFRATQANPGVLTALAPFAQAGVSAFK